MAQLEVVVLENDFDFICATETHLTANIEESEIKLANYKTVRCDSVSNHTGGVLFFVKKEGQVEVISSIAVGKMIWWLVIKVCLKGKSIILVAVYRSPDNRNSPELVFCDFFENKVEDLCSAGADVIVMGDFNIDWFTNGTYKKRIYESILDISFKQIVAEPTRITETSSTLIDYVITNSEKVNVKGNKEFKISDHESLEINIETSCEDREYNKRVIKLLAFKEDVFRRELINNENTATRSNNGVHNISMNFSAKLKTVVEKMMTVRSINGARMNNNWFNQYLYNMKQTKIQLHQIAVWTNNSSDWNKYKVYRNKYAVELQSAKNNFIARKIDQSNDQKSMWRTIKTLVLNEEKSEINEIIWDNKTIRNKTEIANKLNSFFVKSVEEINGKIPLAQYMNLVNITNEQTFKFQLINMSELKNIMKNMNTKRDVNGLSVKMILCALDIIGPCYLSIINESLRQGIFPNCWKESTVVPIEKVKRTVNPAEFRPVNMLMTESKILEKVVHKQLQKYMESNKLLTEYQSGFRQHHSCESLLNLVITQWKTDIADKRVIVAVFLDLQRAFETIDRSILVQKLERYGIKGVELEWFKSYLSNRVQRTRVSNELSERLTVTLGVPQGAVLGTLLFIIYINDLGNVLQHAKARLFADDTLLYVSGSSADECIEQLNADLISVEGYLKMNKLKLNTGKTKTILINGISNMNIMINGEIIEKVNEIKYLGVVLDTKLSFEAHLNHICKKIAKKIGFFQRIRSKVSIDCAIKIYNVMVKPHFEYCSTILFLGPNQMLNRLQKLQNRGMRCILMCNRLTPVRLMLDALQWLTVNQRTYMNVLLFIFKMKNNMLPSYLFNQIIHVDDVQPYNLRNRNDFRLPFFSTNRGQNILCHKGFKLFNSLPNTLKMEKNVIVFKKLLILHVKARYN